MDDVAEAASITKRTLYRYFTSKDKLLYEIHETFSGQSLVPGNPDDHENTVAEFTALVKRHIDVVSGRQKEIGVFFEERKHLTGHNRRLIERRRDDYERYMVSIIEFGIAEGEFVNLNARPTAQAILGALTETYRWYSPAGPLTAPEIADVFVDLFLHGAAVNRHYKFEGNDNVPAILSAERSAGSAAERVREAGIREFARVGYHSTSIRDLADVADVTKGAVMYHAGYKDRLLEEILRSTFEAGIDLLLACNPKSGRAIDSLHRLLVVHMRFVGANHEAITVINDSLRYLQPAAYARVIKLRDQWLSIFRDTIARGVDEGDLRDFDTGFLTRTLVGIFTSTARWYDSRGQLRPDDIAEVYWLLLMFGLSTEVR